MNIWLIVVNDLLTVVNICEYIVDSGEYMANSGEYERRGMVDNEIISWSWLFSQNDHGEYHGYQAIWAWNNHKRITRSPLRTETSRHILRILQLVELLVGTLRLPLRKAQVLGATRFIYFWFPSARG